MFEITDLLTRSEIIKSNKKRTVYRIDGFYVKHEHPTEWFHKIKNLFNPKSKKEFESGLLLKNTGISSVPVVRWERRGFDSYLVTQEISGTFLLRDLLLNFDISFQEINSLLTSLSGFLNSLVEKKVYHPDLHSGNILVKKENGRYHFYLVDLYGVRLKKDISKKDLFDLFGWLVTVLWPLDEDRIKDFLVSSGFCNEREAEDRWLELVRYRIAYIRHRCRKRKKKLFTNSSICKAIRLRDTVFLIKDKGAEKRKCDFIMKVLSNEDALRCWENSYFLSLFGIPVLSHFLWVKNKSLPSVIMVEMPKKLRPLSYLDSDKVAFAVERFNFWTNMAGIKAEISLDSVFVSNNGLFPLVFSNPENFYLKL